MSDVKDFSTDTLLRDTAQVLRDGEWGQGNSGTCLMAALAVATFDGKFPMPTYEKAITRMGFSKALDGIKWNDARGRTKEQVIERVEQSISVDVYQGVKP
jgi:hypothetical protein